MTERYEVADALPLAEVRDLVIEFAGNRRTRAHRIGPISMTVRRGEPLAVVGRSGAGKSTIASALLGLLPTNARVVEGDVTIGGESLLRMPRERLRQLRGSRMAMVFQDCTTAMDPLRRVDRAFADVIRAHDDVASDQIKARTRTALRNAQLDPDRCLKLYPHELSGGMRQRAMIALAMVNNPELLIADEPTTALDPSIQLAILDLLHEVSADAGLVLVTHDLKVARNLCTRVVVMDRGRVVEEGPIEQIMSDPQHEHTRELLV